jgi:signal transduction histidine kinase
VIETVPRSQGRVARFGQEHHRTVDALVAATWLLFSVPAVLVSTLEFDPGSSGRPFLAWLEVAIALAAGAAIALLRRRRPVLATAIVVVVTLPLGLLDPGLANLAVAFTVFALAVYDSTRRAWIAAALSAGVNLVFCGIHILFGIATWADIDSNRANSALSVALVGILMLVVAALWGQNAGARKRYIDELIDHAQHLERDRERQVQLATLAERSRIARDLHDIVAHSLSVVVRLADGADAVFEREPDRARGAIGQVAGVARSSLTEMRRLVGMLDSGPDSLRGPGAGFDDLEQLVDVYRGVGLPISFELRGDAVPEAGVQLTVFRVIQESLTNVLRHATAPTAVFVEVESTAESSVESSSGTTVTIRNDGAQTAVHPDGAGRGILGMHERAQLYGGHLRAEREGRDQWVVTMVLPGRTR